MIVVRLADPLRADSTLTGNRPPLVCALKGLRPRIDFRDLCLVFLLPINLSNPSPHQYREPTEKAGNSFCIHRSSNRPTSSLPTLLAAWKPRGLLCCPCTAPVRTICRHSFIHLLCTAYNGRKSRHTSFACVCNCIILDNDEARDCCMSL